jgi:hypothetical protein
LFISQLQTLSTIQFQIFYQIETICSKINHPKGKLASPSAWLICSSSLPQPLGGSAGSAMDASKVRVGPRHLCGLGMVFDGIHLFSDIPQMFLFF